MDLYSLRKEYGNSLCQVGAVNDKIIVLDSEVSNSTGSEIFKNMYPSRFIETFIAEQNMVGVAIGLGRSGFLPFVSTFGAFFSRAFDQIRMAGLSNVSIIFTGTHCGISIGPDGGSQMALQDIGMFNLIPNAQIFYPSSAISTGKIMEILGGTDQVGEGCKLNYLRITRNELPEIYNSSSQFKIGGSSLIYKSGISNPEKKHEQEKEEKTQNIVLIGAGITIHEIIKTIPALEKLEAKNKNIKFKIIDLYCLKPIDLGLLLENMGCNPVGKSFLNTKIIIVEDHYFEGGINNIISSLFSRSRIIFGEIFSLSVNKVPQSGTTEELLQFAGIDSPSILELTKKLIS